MKPLYTYVASRNIVAVISLCSFLSSSVAVSSLLKVGSVVFAMIADGFKFSGLFQREGDIFMCHRSPEYICGILCMCTSIQFPQSPSAYNFSFFFPGPASECIPYFRSSLFLPIPVQYGFLLLHS